MIFQTLGAVSIWAQMFAYVASSIIVRVRVISYQKGIEVSRSLTWWPDDAEVNECP